MAIRKIVSRSIGIDVIAAEDIANNAITVAEISNGAVTADKLASNSVTTAKLDTAGISATFAAGAVGTPSITTAGDTNTGIFFPAADTIAFTEGGAEAMRIDSSGNVGIGTTSPSSKLHVAGGSGSTIRNTASAGSSWFVGSNVDSYILHNESNTPMLFTTNGTEQARIDSSGNFKFNSGYGSVATAYGCRAWVNFNGFGALTGTYSQSGTAITVTVTSHGLSQGQSVYITFQTGTATAEAFTVTSVTSANIFVVTSVTSRTTSGNCTLATIIRESGNVSSITDNGTGRFTINFTTAMPDANYAITGAGGEGGTTGMGLRTPSIGTVSTSSVHIASINQDATYMDPVYCCISIFR